MTGLLTALGAVQPGVELVVTGGVLVPVAALDAPGVGLAGWAHTEPGELRAAVVGVGAGADVADAAGLISHRF